jgi:hypothetical protein
LRRKETESTAVENFFVEHSLLLDAQGDNVSAVRGFQTTHFAGPNRGQFLAVGVIKSKALN